MPPDDKSKIEELRKSLYSKSNPPPDGVKRRRLHPDQRTINDQWGNTGVINDETEEEIDYAPKYSAIFKGLLIFAILFFIASLGIAAYVYYKGSNTVSSNNITLSVIAPVSIAAGDPLSIDIDITNRNKTALELADLTFTYPDGTRSAADLDTPLLVDNQPIDSLASGETTRKNSRAILYGEENTRANIKVTLTYRISGSNAVFTKEADYNVLIASAPVSLSVDTLKEVNSGQNISITAHLLSNSTSVLHSILFNVDYPFGFTLTSATPTPAFGNHVFNIGDLSPGERRDITIIGKIEGQDGEQRVFHFNTGTASSTDSQSIGVVFINTSETLAIKKPFLSSQLVLNKSVANPYVTRLGDIIHGEIDFQNNLSTPITGASIQLSLNGTILDKSSVHADNGFYSSANNSIIWDSSSVSDLATLAPGASGSVTFDFSPVQPSFDVNKNFKNPIINLSESVAGKRFSDTNVPEVISSGVSTTIKVASNLALASSALHSIGPFVNVGPIPPKVDQPTTYTIELGITNSFNQVDNAIVSATLPSYVKWLSVSSPTTESISYNSNTRVVTWQAGTIAPATGFATSPKRVSFQISLTPSESQVGGTVDLVQNLTIKGVDNFTNATLVNTNPNLTTRTFNDPNFKYTDDTVVK